MMTTAAESDLVSCASLPVWLNAINHLIFWSSDLLIFWLSDLLIFWSFDHLMFWSSDFLIFWSSSWRLGSDISYSATGRALVKAPFPAKAHQFSSIVDNVEMIIKCKKILNKMLKGWQESAPSSRPTSCSLQGLADGRSRQNFLCARCRWLHEAGSFYLNFRFLDLY